MRGIAVFSNASLAREGASGAYGHGWVIQAWDSDCCAWVVLRTGSRGGLAEVGGVGESESHSLLEESRALLWAIDSAATFFGEMP